MQPTFRNLSGSFEQWAYRGGFLRQVHALEQLQILESSTKPGSTDRVYRLTEAGRLAALGGRDPEAWWARPWDGTWRMVIFDLPESQRSLRHRLRRKLRGANLGCLQQSVWVTPDRLEVVRERLKSLKVDAGTLLFFEGLACGGERNCDIVERAWDFAEIQRCYRRHGDHLKTLAAVGKRGSLESLAGWMAEERARWMACMAVDPLLPEALHPSNYKGREARERRAGTLSKLGKLVKRATDKT